MAVFETKYSYSLLTDHLFFNNINAHPKLKEHAELCNGVTKLVLKKRGLQVVIVDFDNYEDLTMFKLKYGHLYENDHRR